MKTRLTDTEDLLARLDQRHDELSHEAASSLRFFQGVYERLHAEQESRKLLLMAMRCEAIELRKVEHQVGTNS